jgi:hypothetical protein
MHRQIGPVGGISVARRPRRAQHEAGALTPMVGADRPCVQRVAMLLSGGDAPRLSLQYTFRSVWATSRLPTRAKRHFLEYSRVDRFLLILERFAMCQASKFKSGSLTNPKHFLSSAISSFNEADTLLTALCNKSLLTGFQSLNYSIPHTADQNKDPVFWPYWPAPLSPESHPLLLQKPCPLLSPQDVSPGASVLRSPTSAL